MDRTDTTRQSVLEQEDSHCWTPCERIHQPNHADFHRSHKSSVTAACSVRLTVPQCKTQTCEAVALIGLVVLAGDTVPEEGARVDGAGVGALGRRLVHQLVRDVEAVHVEQKVADAQMYVSDFAHLMRGKFCCCWRRDIT